MKKTSAAFLIIIVILSSFVGYKWYIHNSIKSLVALAKLTNLTLDTTFLPAESLDLSFENFTFKVPAENKSVESEKNKNSLKIKITDNKTITVVKTAEGNFIDSIKNGYFIESGEKKLLSKEVIKLMQTEEITSEYKLLKFIYEQDPDNIRFFSSNAKLKIQYELLSLKNAFALSGGEKYLGYFENNSTRGFQACNPTLETCVNTLVQLFTNPDDSTIFIFKGLNQEEINYVINSVTESANF